MTHEAGTGDSSPRLRRRRWVWVALVVSLTFNLLFVGVIAGAAWARWHVGWSGPRHFSFSQSVERLIAELPAERRPVAERVLASYSDNVRPMWREVGAARRAVIEALQAEPYDEARARAALDTLYETQMDARRRFGAHMLELMGELTAEERKEFLSGFGTRRRGARN